MNSDREARKRALEAAKERLANRRKQKEALQRLRQEKKLNNNGINGGDSTNDNNKKNDYGKKLIDDTKELMEKWKTTKEKEEEKLRQEQAKNDNDDSKNNNAKIQIVPGLRADLNMVDNINTIIYSKRSRVEYVKEIQTDAVEIGTNIKPPIITDKTTNDELNEILATFIENDINPWPNKKDQVYKRITIQKQEEKKQQQQEEEKIMNQSQQQQQQEEEILVLSDENATKLLSSSGFIQAFKKQSKFLDAILGINEEHSVFIEANSTIRDIKESSQMEKLIKFAELSSSFTNGRPITCLDFDNNFGNRFLASYSGAFLNNINIDSNNNDNNDKNDDEKDNEEQKSSSSSSSSSPLNIQSDGLINIYSFDETSSEYKLIRSLECQSMINCVQFHPTKENMIIGASVSGQVLGWDMRLNKKTPTLRTEFSSSCHTQPIFALKFLPSMSYMPSSKIQQILTLSNDGKLCVWRDDMLFQPNNEFLLKLSKNNNKSDGGGISSSSTSSSSNQAKEITTTCFSYPKYFNEKNNKLWLGSDEGCIYETSLNLNKNDEKELSITSYISSAHYGPITCIDFYSCISPNDDGINQLKRNGLYLTSSFDWTVKLWHISSSKPLSIFNQMQDYVYDVSWSPTNPSIFAVVDGSGNLTIFDLNISFEHPASEPTNIQFESINDRPNNYEQISITKLLWSPNGKQIVIGDSKGRLIIYECPVYDPTDTDFDKFEAIIKRKIESAENR